ncbi:MAG: nucleotidyltransferase domain-containing protein [Scytonematopsis contorta HA4267-MV1]|jgi:predicted nucleotidyltransferase|nr:nucleotidyltransferase domain-containing protein [Scytonematopsis contorta HA4267-MV1]
MNTVEIQQLREFSQQIPTKSDYIKMLILFGSRATGKTHTSSDWDFAVLCNEEKRNRIANNNGFAYFELPFIFGQIFGINPDNIDIVELAHCSELIAHHVARDGIILYEQSEGEFESFKQKSLLNQNQVNKIYRDLQSDINKFLKEWAV